MSRNVAAGDDAPMRRLPGVRLVAAAALFTIIGALVVAPFTRRGWLLLLDWAQGPRIHVPRSVWALDGSVTAAAPFNLGVVILNHLIGPATVSWLLVAAIFPLAGIGMARLVPGSWIAQVTAGLAFTLSPIVYERIWAGQVAFLLGYALLPWTAAAVLRIPKDGWPAAVRAGLWIAGLSALAPHFAFIAGLLVLGVVVQQRFGGRALARAMIVVAIAGLGSAYLIIGSGGKRAGSTSVGLQDVASYRTTADPRVGLYVNVVGQYGFWRLEPRLPKDDVAGWPILLGAILLVGAAGVRAAWHDESARHLVIPLLFAGIAGFFLALGTQGPTAAVFRWLFLHLPGFAVMREPQKFTALLALAAAAFFGVGADRLVDGAQRPWGRTFLAAAVVALPVGYNPSLFFGLHHRLAVVHYPSSWQDADRLMGSGPGKILALPWHQYLAYPFVGRNIANPSVNAFQRDVISGDNVELPTIRSSSGLDRSRYLEFLYAQGPSTTAFGHLVASTGIEYIGLEKAADWRSYGWLDNQQDLVRVLDTPDLTLYRNLAALPAGESSKSVVSVPDWYQLIAAANRGELAGHIVTVEHPTPGPDAPPDGLEPPVAEASEPPRSIQRRSPVAYRFGAGAAGVVALPEPFDQAWHSKSGHAFETAQGEVAVPVGSTAGSVRFTFWPLVARSYWLSILTFLVGAVATAATVARRRRRY